MDAGEITGAIAVVVSVATAIIGFINHKRIRSNCCGRDMSVSVDIENTTPPGAAAVPPPPISAPPV